MSDDFPAGHHPLFEELERDIAAARVYVTAHFSAHTLLESLMSGLNSLIDTGRKLKAERAALLTDRDSQKARADKVEADRDAFRAQMDADDKTAADAAADLAAEVDAEAPQARVDTAPVTVIVTAPANANTSSLSVSPPADSSLIGATVAGDAVAPSTIVRDVAPDGSVVLSQPTIAAHSGDGSETLTITPAA